MLNWKGIVGTGLTVEQFDVYCHTLHWLAWRPSFIVLHNTAVPTLADRPNGFTQQHMKNFESYYRDTKHWNAGPHLFIDDHLIWVFTPLTVSGVHSPAWNKQSVGIEMLGNYETEPFNKKRGLKVQNNTIAAIATLCAVLGIDSSTLRLHKEDPITTHATCPGKNVNKENLITKVHNLILERHVGEHDF
jgi:hypothetical protein